MDSIAQILAKVGMNTGKGVGRVAQGVGAGVDPALESLNSPLVEKVFDPYSYNMGKYYDNRGNNNLLQKRPMPDQETLKRYILQKKMEQMKAGEGWQ